MKKYVCILVLLLVSVAAHAFDMPVPEELIGGQTMGVVHLNFKAFKLDQALKTVADKVGAAPDAQAVEPFKAILQQFSDAGGTGITILFNAGKDADAANAGDGVVLVLNKGEGASDEKLTALVDAMGAPFKDKMAEGCPKKVGDALVWHAAKFKLPKVNEERAGSFSEAYSHLTKDSTISAVFVPSADALELAEAQLKDAKPEEAEMVKALFGASGFCVVSNFGAAGEPNLKVLVLAADADGAAVLEKAVTGLLGEGKKSAPPPIQKFIDNLKVAQAGANVEMSIDLGELSTAIKALAGGPPGQ